MQKGGGKVSAKVSQPQGTHPPNQTKWVVVTGGVVSGIGKGTTTAAIGKLLSRNFKVVPIKCDGYLNIDPGTMNPFEHGEVFVLEDGGEVDMDFGHYERFLNINCKSEWNLTTGKVYDSIIKKERRGEFLGKTVQIIPHLTDEIKRQWMKIAKEEKAEIVTIEIGGTVGDIENAWFVEAARQLKKDVGHDNVLYVHLTYVPYLKSVGQQKTKPAQRDVQILRETGIFPDVIIARSQDKITTDSRQKIALFCDIQEEAVIPAPDIHSIYEIPVDLEEQGFLPIISKKFDFTPKRDLEEWRRLLNGIRNYTRTVTVALCGKYTGLTDSYASLIEALNHAGANLNAKVIVKMIETTDIEEGKAPVDQVFSGVDGIIVPIGFGSRGAEGKISSVRYAREKNIPYLGLCYGLQIAVIEFARNVCGLKDANSTEINPKTKHPVVMILPEQQKILDKGGTMRLGAEKAFLKHGSRTAQLYGQATAIERHRHRYEVNPKYHRILEKNGLMISGTSRDGRLVEFIEIPNLKYFLATQAHPEYKSRLETPSPLYYGFVKAAIEKKYGKS